MRNYAMSVRDIATLFGVSRQAVYKWRKHETFPRAAELGGGFLDVKRIFTWWLYHHGGEEEQTKAMAMAKLEYLRARVRREEHLVKELEARLKPADEVARDLVVVFVVIALFLKARFTQLSTRLLEESGIELETFEAKKIIDAVNAEAQQTLTLLEEGLGKLIGDAELKALSCDNCCKKIFSISV